MDEKLVIDVAKDLVVAAVQDSKRTDPVDVVDLFSKCFKEALASFREEFLLKEELEQSGAEAE